MVREATRLPEFGTGRWAIRRPPQSVTI